MNARASLVTTALMLVFVAPVFGRADEGSESSRVWSLLRDQGLTGTVRLDYYHSSKALDDQTDFLGATTQLTLRPTVNQRLDGRIDARVTNPDVGTGTETAELLREAYLTARFARIDVRIGRQIVAWGRADGINPTDNLTPRDFVVLLPFEDDQRFGVPALKVDGYLTPELTLTLFTTPFFEPHRIPLGDGLIEEIPSRTFKNTEVGVKLNRAGEGGDWSVSYYHGFDLLPDAYLVNGAAGGPLIALRHNRIDVIGADAARNLGRYGLRAEAAYVFTHDRRGDDPTIKNPFAFWVIGGDRTLGENVNINLQLVGRWVHRYHDPTAIGDPAGRAVAVQNAILDVHQDRATYGLSSRVSDKWFNDTLEAEVLVFVNFRRTNTYVRPVITYAFTDHLKGTLGGELYTGPNESFFGRLKTNRGPFVEARYSF
ncbi:MAG: DUF1302 family protein [Nitrospirota bacterium]